MVDDYIPTFMQMVRYYHFLKGENPGTGPGKTKLMLRVGKGMPNGLGIPKASMRQWQVYQVAVITARRIHILKEKKYSHH